MKRGFNFQILIPPMVNSRAVPAVQPQENTQENTENSGDFLNTLQQGHSKCFDKEQSMPFTSGNVAAAAKPARQDFPKMKAVAPMEKDENNPGQLYSKLFDEVDKIKCWKVKVDSDTVQKERKLQENKRIIESQRKAIHELQFGNENVSVKLEEQLSENEDLRNKNNATRNLCNILKDTFERSAAKMHLFESEREETHHVLVENSERVQKLVAAFESLRIQVEADQEEMQKVKENLEQFEDLKEKYHQAYNTKENEVLTLLSKLRETETELQKILLDLHDTKNRYLQLQETTNEQNELLKSSKNQQESLLEELHTAKQRCEESEKSSAAVASMLEKSKEEFTEVIRNKDLNLEELSRVKAQQAEKLEQIQTTVEDLQNSLALETQRANELEQKLTVNNEQLERINGLLGEAMEHSTKKDEQIQVLKDELDNIIKSSGSMNSVIEVTKAGIEELTAELSRKNEEIQILKSEAEAVLACNDLLKKACEAAETAQANLKEKSTETEAKVLELEEKLVTEKKENKGFAIQMEQMRKKITQHETMYEELLSNFNGLQSEKAEIQQQLESVEANMKVSEDKAVKLLRKTERLEEENHHLQTEVNYIKNKAKEEYQTADTLEKTMKENYNYLQEEIVAKEKKVKAIEMKNEVLKMQIAKETAKSSNLELVIKNLLEESRDLQRLNEEKHEKLLQELESRSVCAAELRDEVQKLGVRAEEAVKVKEDIELKCQHKIADMISLMEKHKNQYDQMIEKKDAELDETKKKEMEAVSCQKSLELHLEKCKTHNDKLDKQLKAEMARKKKLQEELTELKKEMSSIKSASLTEVVNKQSPGPECRPGVMTPKDRSSRRHVFGFSKTRKTPSSRDDGKIALAMRAESAPAFIGKSNGTTPKTWEMNKDLITPRRNTDKVGRTSDIKTFRIRTPPAVSEACWGQGATACDFTSESSDPNDILSFTCVPAPSFSGPQCKQNFEKMQSPASHKSPGNSLKLAAMKRMRDAGWTAVTGCGKKKKSNEKIFA
ncbi:uncharacterized protein V6R79_021026 [Siganus canaliculatus]